MEGQEGTLHQKLAKYLDAVRGVSTHDEWWSYFVELVRPLAAGCWAKDPWEKQMYQGREFTLLDNLVFHFRQDLHTRWGDPTRSLKQYVADLRTRRPRIRITVVVTSGLAFHVYTPKFDKTGRVLELEATDGLNLDSALMTPEQALRDLGRIVSRARPGQREPTS